jgi:hypothetical protein
MRKGKLTWADIATLRAAAPRGLRRFGKGWAAHYAGARYHMGPVTTLLRAGYLDNEPDETGPRLVLTRKGREALACVPAERELLGRAIAAAMGEQERLSA